MAIFIIGVKNLNGQRYFRLLNTSTAPMKTRDMSEEDLMYMLDGNSSFKIENAELSPRKDKIVGKTGSLDKIENHNSYVVLGSLIVDGKHYGYRIVDSYGLTRDLTTENAIRFLKDKSIQNASIVDDKYLRGINWEIARIDKRLRVEKTSMDKPIQNSSSDLDANPVCSENPDSYKNPVSDIDKFSGTSEKYDDPNKSYISQRPQYEEQADHSVYRDRPQTIKDVHIGNSEMTPLGQKNISQRIDTISPRPVKVRLMKGEPIKKNYPVHIVLSFNNFEIEALDKIEPRMKKWILTDNLYYNQILFKVKKISYILYAPAEMLENGYLRKLKIVFGNRVKVTGQIDDIVEITIADMFNGFYKDLRELCDITSEYGHVETFSVQKPSQKSLNNDRFLSNVATIFNRTHIFDDASGLSQKEQFNTLLFLIDYALLAMRPFIQHVCSQLGIRFLDNYRTSIYKKIGNNARCSVDYTSDNLYGFALVTVDEWL